MESNYHHGIELQRLGETLEFLHPFIRDALLAVVARLHTHTNGVH